MTTRAPFTWPLFSLLGCLALASPALAQGEDEPYRYPDEEEEAPSRRGRAPPEDTPYAYPDDEDPPASSRPKRRSARDAEYKDPDDFRRAERGEEEEKDFERLARTDDPNTGIAFEVLGGVMLLSSPRGQFLGDPVPAFGGRFTWEYGRLLNSEPLREALWLDARYGFVGQREGTALVVGDVQRHYVSLAPAYELTFGEGSDYGLYAQVGGGIVYELSRLEVGGKLTPVEGIKPLIQYGVGLRGRTKLSATSNLRLTWRLELMRFRRGYQDDTSAGLSAGLGF
ncbi:hypothetical protein CYFUS_006118 [Cystobacter fuscus]|uniref:Outer membrane protein beta-barrel domain-containing protein n=1 Tax=Cystobacter fuscus TaxID=43 RepID=A0A250JAX8_9BACT|nr:hypothetical protein [Cystobacter fuscus]ATB40667.1 hypothetical protein CYFUS_006118 [Cystobacter fuscus]